MKKNRGFTLIELMIVVAIIGILAAIAIPNFIRFQARARQAEPNVNLKALYTGVKTINQNVFPGDKIHAFSFAPDRGNRYAYMLEDACSKFENRDLIDAVTDKDDTCIGIDHFKFPAIPSTYTPEHGSHSWNAKGQTDALGETAGIVGAAGSWSFLAYAAGDVDNTVGDKADTWAISDDDSTGNSSCPALATDVPIAAGEPFNTYNDVNCD